MTRFTERFIGGTSVLGESGHRRVFFCLADAFNMFEICDFMKGILCFGGEVGGTVGFFGGRRLWILGVGQGKCGNRCTKNKIFIFL